MKYLIYDQHCPLCQWYTARFVACGLINGNERLSFEQAEEAHLMEHIDASRALREIPLHIPNANLTLYGPEALVYLLDQRFHGLRKVYQLYPVKAISNLLYRFISNNRRILAGSACTEDVCRYEPKPHLPSRLVLIALACLLSIAITWWYGAYWTAREAIGHPFEMLLMCGTGWFIFSSAILLKGGVRHLDAIGNISVVMTLGVVALTPPLLADLFINVPQAVIGGFTLISALVMFREMHRRLTGLQYPAGWTLAWSLILVTSFTSFLLAL